MTLALTRPLGSARLHDMQLRLFDLVIVIQLDGYLAVSFYSCYRFNNYFLHFFTHVFLILFEIRLIVFDQLIRQIDLFAIK